MTMIALSFILASILIGCFGSLESFSDSSISKRQSTSGCSPSFVAIGPTLFSDTVFAVQTFKSLVYAAGNFQLMSGKLFNHISKWNGTHWTTLSNGTDAPVYALAEFQSNLIVAGDFLSAGNLTVRRIASWNGLEWFPLKNGPDILSNIPSSINVLKSMGNRLAIGGVFALSPSLNYTNIAMWDGYSASSLGLGVQNQKVLAIEEFQSILYVGGSFTQVGGMNISGIARWNGTNWQSVGVGTLGTIKTMHVFQNELVVAGQFYSIGGLTAANIAKWNGTAWIANVYGSGLNNDVNTMLSIDDDNLYIGGTFTLAGSLGARRFVKWNATGWSTIGFGSAMGENSVETIVSNNGSYELLVAGSFNTVNGSAFQGLVKYLACSPKPTPSPSTTPQPTPIPTPPTPPTPPVTSSSRSTNSQTDNSEIGSSTPSSSNLGMIVGVVVGAIVLLIIIAVVIIAIVVLRKWKREREERGGQATRTENDTELVKKPNSQYQSVPNIPTGPKLEYFNSPILHPKEEQRRKEEKEAQKQKEQRQQYVNTNLDPNSKDIQYANNPTMMQLPTPPQNVEKKVEYANADQI